MRYGMQIIWHLRSLFENRIKSNFQTEKNNLIYSGDKNGRNMNNKIVLVFQIVGYSDTMLSQATEKQDV